MSQNSLTLIRASTDIGAPPGQKTMPPPSPSLSPPGSLFDWGITVFILFQIIKSGWGAFVRKDQAESQLNGRLVQNLQETNNELVRSIMKAQGEQSEAMRQQASSMETIAKATAQLGEALQRNQHGVEMWQAQIVGRIDSLADKIGRLENTVEALNRKIEANHSSS